MPALVGLLISMTGGAFLALVVHLVIGFLIRREDRKNLEKYEAECAAHAEYMKRWNAVHNASPNTRSAYR